MLENTSPRGDRPVNPRRRRRTKMETFREAYLPFLIIVAAVILIVAVIAAIASGKKQDGDGTTDGNAALAQQAASLLEQAAALAENYDYEGALELLNGFEGDPADHPDLREALYTYTGIVENMVQWSAEQVTNLSFHVLIADLSAALADSQYGSAGNGAYNKNFITTDEFSAILQQLYDNGYVLVSLSDLYATDESGDLCKTTLKLPAGKTPFLLTQTHCNYYTYMEDSHAFANKLLYNGCFYNEMITASGDTLVGNFDLIPILEAFIAQHPDFSYRGARAILACSGFDGVFGYRITDGSLDAEALAAQTQAAIQVADALRAQGYTFACYTYNNTDYSLRTAAEIENDICLWRQQIAPVVGETDILVYAWEADIGESYEGNEKYTVLHEQGFRIFMGSSAVLWSKLESDYVRHNRMMVTGSNLAHNGDWFSDLFNAAGILDLRRGTIPT